MKTQHTAGPWTIRQHSDMITVRGIDNGIEDDLCALPSSADANAALVAAAPELLEALENLTSELHKHHKMNVKKDYSLMVADASARTAIAKAKGEL